MTPTIEQPIAHPIPRVPQQRPAGGAGGGKSTPPAPPTITPQAAGGGDDPGGIAAYGTLIQVLADAGPPEVYVSIEGVGDITGPNVQIAEAETTSHSTGAPVRTFLPTLIDPGEQSFPCFWNPSDATQSASSPYGMERLFYDRTVTKFRLVNTDPTHRTRAYKGYVKSLGETYPLAGICTRNIAIRILGVMTDVASAIDIKPNKVTVDATGVPVAPIDVETGGSNAPWLATSLDSWITITAPVDVTVGDDTITFTCTANPDPAARVGTIHVAALNLSCEITQTGTP